MSPETEWPLLSSDRQLEEVVSCTVGTVGTVTTTANYNTTTTTANITIYQPQQQQQQQQLSLPSYSKYFLFQF